MSETTLAAAVSLAKLAVAYERAIQVYFPAFAHDMAALGSKILAEHGIAYWISPDGRSLTCTQCRLTSHHPVDVGNRYCGACRQFLENREKPHEEHRQATLLALAELALWRPDWDLMLGEIADSFEGRHLFDEYKLLNADRVKASRV